MKLYVVAIGPGNLGEITPRALAALAACDAVAGDARDLDLLDELVAGKNRLPVAAEGPVSCCGAALAAAGQGRTVAVVDGGGQALSALVCRMARQLPGLEVEVIPAVPPEHAAAAVLGAPLGDAYAVASLDAPPGAWLQVENRLRHAAGAGFVLCLTCLTGAPGRLEFACRAAMEYRPPQTPCGVVRNAGRSVESSALCTLEQLAALPVAPPFCALIGGEHTVLDGGRLVTPPAAGWPADL